MQPASHVTTAAHSTVSFRFPFVFLILRWRAYSVRKPRARIRARFRSKGDFVVSSNASQACVAEFILVQAAWLKIWILHFMQLMLLRRFLLLLAGEANIVARASRRCGLEMQLDDLTASIREKPEWWRKVELKDTVGRWKAEAADQGVAERTWHFAIQARTLLCRICVPSSKHAREGHDTTWRGLCEAAIYTHPCHMLQ
jgi:hypothetical protein